MRNIVAGLLLLALAALFSSTGIAGPTIWRGDNQSVLLTDKPCTDAKVLAHIQPDKHGMYKQAAGQLGERKLMLCIAKVPDTLVTEPSYFIVDEDGDFGMLPQSEFEPYTDQKPKPTGTDI
jgi:hypothetical protein